MPVIYGNSKGGIAHRELQPEPGAPEPEKRRKKPLPVKILDWRAVVVGGVVYETAHHADVALGWRAGTCEDALRSGASVCNGKSVRRAQERGAGKGGKRG